MTGPRPRLRAKLRRAAQFALIYALYASGALKFAKWLARRRSAVLVLTFHRVLEPGEYACTSSLPGMVVREATFASIMRYLSQRALPLDLRQGSAPGPDTRQRFAITFDDGWLDTAQIAFPIAQAHGIPIAVFICPGLEGRRAPFWPERYAALRRRTGEADIAGEIEHLKRAPAPQREQTIALLERTTETAAVSETSEPSAAVTSWAQIEGLAAAGVCIGSHTQTHQILTTIPASAAETEIAASKREIASRLGQCDAFAYPNGDWSPVLRKILLEHGYRLAFTTEPGWWTPSADKLAIPRINMSERKVTGPRGNFSRAVFEYSCFWKPMLHNLRGSRIRSQKLA